MSLLKNCTIKNNTKLVIDEKKWLNWIDTYCTKAPISVNVIYNPTPDEIRKKDLYRGGFLYGEIWVFFDKYENKQSLDWIFLHELGHWIYWHRKEISEFIESTDLQLDRQLKKYKAQKGFKEDKKFETELDYEEFFANTFAILVLGKNFDGQWYKNREEKK